MEIIKMIASKKKTIAILCLAIVWILFSSIFFHTTSFSVVTYRVGNSSPSQLIPTDPYTHVVFQGEFQARDNNLGLIILPLNPHNLLNNPKDEFVAFSFKEKSDKTWSFRREYSIRLFDSQSSFAFGFPLISDSKNKIYQFQVVSPVTDKDTIEIKKNESFITGYQYSRQEIKSHLAAFIFNKIIGSLTDSEFITRLLLQLILLVLFGFCFLLFFSKLKQIVSNHKINKKQSNFKVLVYYFEYVKKSTKALNSTYTFVLCLILIMLWLLIIPFSLDTIQNLLNVIVYGLLVVGCIQIYFESRES